MDRELRELERRASTDPRAMRAFSSELARRGLGWDLGALPRGLAVGERAPFYEWRPYPGSCFVVPHAQAGVRFWAAPAIFAQLFKPGPAWIASVFRGEPPYPRHEWWYGGDTPDVLAALREVLGRGLAWAVLDPGCVNPLHVDELAVVGSDFVDAGGALMLCRPIGPRRWFRGSSLRLVDSTDEAKELVRERLSSKRSG